jgi:hypothetical protein
MTDLNTFSYQENVIKGDNVFAEYGQKYAYFICSTDAPSWITTS